MRLTSARSAGIAWCVAATGAALGALPSGSCRLTWTIASIAVGNAVVDGQDPVAHSICTGKCAVLSGRRCPFGLLPRQGRCRDGGQRGPPLRKVPLMHGDCSTVAAAAAKDGMRR
mmetsp:Transcript_570/g.2373  ORF Transcript_570/g.2373 Transcript_570/m.2373 type:complete len:115 (-) Transcript_570:1468-1812(-)